MAVLFISIVIVFLVIVCAFAGASEEKKELKNEPKKKLTEEEKSAKLNELYRDELNRVCKQLRFNSNKGKAWLYLSDKDGKQRKFTIFHVDGKDKHFLICSGSVEFDKETGEPAIKWNYPWYWYKFSQLIDFSIVDNGNQYIAGDASGAAGGAMVGNMIGGNNGAMTGAIIGAAAMNRNIESECYELGVLLRINDLQHPLVRMNFLEYHCSRKSEMYRESREWMDDIVALLTYIKHNA